jgi:catechol 2,3-dioxygenase-like lactoylglutathione lyase family enzyme
MITAIHHVQLAMPAGAEEDAAGFYEAILGIPRVSKPPHLARRGGCWFESASVKVHLGVEQDFQAARKAHPAFLVDDLAPLADLLAAAGYELRHDEPLEGYERIYVDDPFGNRIELLQGQS